MRNCFTFICLLAISVGLQAQVSDFGQVNFYKADSIALRYHGHSLRDIKNLSDKLTLPLPTEVEKFRAIYRWVCDNIESDHQLYEKNRLKRKNLTDPKAIEAWRRKASAYTFASLVNKHRTVCTGYAYLIRELAFHSGIRAEIVDGYGRNTIANVGGEPVANHSWNAVKLNNKWYLCDATWSSGATDLRIGKFIKNFDEVYFLADPELFIRNHYPLDVSWTLVENAPTLHEFVNWPLIYRAAYVNKLSRISPGTFNLPVQKGETFTFTYTLPEDVQPKNVTLGVLRAQSAETISVEPHQNSLAEWVITHKFKAKGNYTIHILFDAQYVCTYTVEVRG